ncbi:PDC sensor domain-containing protein [Hippea maritima]|uniref:Histidine kinase HAMP region domain protein n=1 Tax=Hippea maritima (strain ATCC 700847 / DSM 10411 / MH2) TaxID=760142 RepID=F2LTK3_HIPMA|nr:HAMP domain-containing protein [Hippea maritima]AEA33328.1 histidine kinase HAMP region domain protein [Hippea maritima DSM 10411]
MIKRLSTKVVVYTTTLVLITLFIFSMSSIFTIMALKKYALHKTEAIFRQNADENLEKEVVSYAKILKGAMDAKESISYMFGEAIEKEILYNKHNPSDLLENVFNEMNNVLDMRVIAIFDANGKLINKYPSFECVDVLRKHLNAFLTSESIRKIKYVDFHINKDDSVSFSFVYFGKDASKKPIYIVFDYKPYDMYSLIRTAQLYPYSQKYLWVINKKGVLIYDPPSKQHPLITLTDHVDLTDPKNGKLLADVVKKKILKGDTGVARYIFRGVDKFVGYTYVDKYGWGLGLTLPTEIFYKPIKDISKDIDSKTIYTLALFGLFSVIMILSTIVLAFFISKRITVPINETANAVEAILKGDYSRRLKPSGTEEIDKLSEVVNRLLDYFSNRENNEGEGKE